MPCCDARNHWARPLRCERETTRLVDETVCPQGVECVRYRDAFFEVDDDRVATLCVTHEVPSIKPPSMLRRFDKVLLVCGVIKSNMDAIRPGNHCNALRH